MTLKRCAKFKLKTLGVEQFEMPRPKPCAGVVYPRIFEDFDIPNEAIATRLRGIKTVSPSGNQAFIDFPEDGAVIYRDIFDHMLTMRAKDRGAEVIEGVKVTNINIVGDSCKIMMADKGILECRYVVAADGAYSTICRETGKAWSKENLAATLQSTLKISEKDRGSIDGYFEVHYDAERTPGGWTWIAERGGDVLAGLGYPMKYTKQIDKLDQKLVSFLDQKFEKFEILKSESHPIPITGPKPKEDLVISGKVITIGDAGGFVRVDTGEGIYYAMHSGLAAAEAINEAIDSKRSLADAYLDKMIDHGLDGLYKSTELKRVLLNNDLIERYIERMKIISRLLG